MLKWERWPDSPKWKYWQVDSTLHECVLQHCRDTLTSSWHKQTMRVLSSSGVCIGGYQTNLMSYCVGLCTYASVIGHRMTLLMWKLSSGVEEGRHDWSRYKMGLIWQPWRARCQSMRNLTFMLVCKVVSVRVSCVRLLTSSLIPISFCLCKFAKRLNNCQGYAQCHLLFSHNTVYLYSLLTL